MRNEYHFDDFTEEEIRCLEKLEEQFPSILVYKGDDELISSVNSEYSFDDTDVIRTDGDVNFHVHIVQGTHSGSPIYLPKDQYIHYQTCIRNATYLIISDVFEIEGKQKRSFDLRVDRPFLVEKCDEILRQIANMKENISDMEYFIAEWRASSVIKNGTTMLEVATL